LSQLSHEWINCALAFTTGLTGGPVREEESMHKWNIDEECRLGDWFAQHTVNVQQAQIDVGLLVQRGCDRMRLLSDLQKLDQVSGLTGSGKLRGSVAEILTGLTAEMEARALAFPGDAEESLQAVGAAIVTHNQRFKRRQRLMASITRYVTHKTSPRGMVGDNAPQNILGRLFAWVTDGIRPKPGASIVAGAGWANGGSADPQTIGTGAGGGGW
jgi:hypothetical protein